MVESDGGDDLEAGGSQLGPHFGVGVLVLVVRVDEVGLLEPGHPGVGRVDAQVPAGAQDSAHLGEHRVRDVGRHVLNRLPAVDEVDRPVGIVGQIDHGVVAVAHRTELGLGHLVGVVFAVQLVALVRRQVDHDEVVELVGVAHEHQGARGVAEGRAAEVEDAPARRQRAYEDHAAEVERLPEAAEGGHRPPLPRRHGPTRQLLRRDRPGLQSVQVALRAGRVGLAGQHELVDQVEHVGGGAPREPAPLLGPRDREAAGRAGAAERLARWAWTVTLTTPTRSERVRVTIRADDGGPRPDRAWPEPIDRARHDRRTFPCVSPHLVAAPDKFRGTATAAEVAAAVAGAARRVGMDRGRGSHVGRRRGPPRRRSAVRSARPW